MLTGKMRSALRWLLVVCLLGPRLDAAEQKGDSLIWRTRENTVSAEITAWDLDKLLTRIAQATSWQIYVEPDTEYTVSTKFKERTPGEALRLLLGNLSFALLPQTNGPSKLFVFRTSLQEATQLVRVVAKEDPTAKPIPNELIVTLKPGAKIDGLLEKHGAKMLGKLENSYRLSFEDAETAAAAREALLENPEVESVGSNYWMQRPDPSEALSINSGFPFNLKLRPGDSQGLIIGLLDTAIQPTGGPLDAFLLPTVSLNGGQVTLPSDSPSHATTMFGTILRGLSLKGAETSAQVLPVDIYGSNPSTTTFDVAHGIVEAVNRGASIVNLSLGSSGDSDLLRSIITRSSNQGVMFFAAAGNEPGVAPTYPAAYPEVYAVTAGMRDGSIAPYANRGSFIDLMAPGSSIVPYNGSSWLVTGTSASTAYVSGLAASLSDGGKPNPAQIGAALKTLLPVKK